MIRHALLGLIQGVTEFLPVSSSGHLVLAAKLLAVNPPGVLLEAFLHLGTLCAVVWVFRADLRELARGLTRRGTLERRKEIGFLLCGTVPIVVAGLLGRNAIEAAFSSTLVVGGGLLFTSIALAAAEMSRIRATRPALRFVDALVVGLAQAAALVPGVSRSGLTIAAGMARGLRPERAARFSFLLSLPALLGAVLLSFRDALARGTEGIDWGGITVGTVVAAAVGILCIHALLAIVRRSRLWGFSVYCTCLGMAALIAGLL